MVVIRPVSATVMRSDGTAATAPPGQSKVNRPTSALLRGASSHGQHHHANGLPIKTSSSSSNTNPLRGRIRPETAKPRRSSLVHAASEESKRLIHEIFDVCDSLHVDAEFVEALHRNLQSCSLTDTQVFTNLLASLQEHRRATVQVLKRIEARERVLRCFEEFAEEAFLISQHEVSGGGSGSSLGSSNPGVAGGAAMLTRSGGGSGSGSGKDMRRSSSHPDSTVAHRPGAPVSTSPVSAALRRLLEHHGDVLEERLLTLGDQLPVLSAEGDAILQSLHQCTRAVEQALADWDTTAEHMWSGVCPPPAEAQAAGSAKPLDGMQRVSSSPPTPAATPTAMLDPPLPQVQHALGLSAPASLHRRVFPWRGSDYKTKMTIDVAPFEALQERWSLGHLAKVADAHERRNKRARLLADDCALRAHTEAMAAKTRDEFLNIAAAKIQAMFRGHRAAMWFQMYLLKLKAIRCISNWWRKIKLRQRFVSATDFGRAAVHLQRLWRAYVARRAFPALLKANRAAKVIQRWWRYWDSHWRMLVRHLERQHRVYAAAVVSRALLRFVCRWKFRRERRVHRIVAALQRWCRGRTCAQALFAQGRTGAYDEDLTVIVPAHLSLVQELSPQRACDDGTDCVDVACIPMCDDAHESIDMGNTTTVWARSGSPHRRPSNDAASPCGSKESTLVSTTSNHRSDDRGPPIATVPEPAALAARHASPVVVAVDASEVPISEAATVGFQSTCSSVARPTGLEIAPTNMSPPVAPHLSGFDTASACPADVGPTLVADAIVVQPPPPQPACTQQRTHPTCRDASLVTAYLLARHASHVVLQKLRACKGRGNTAPSPTIGAARSIQRWWSTVARCRLQQRRSYESLLLASFSPSTLRAHVPTTQQPQRTPPTTDVCRPSGHVDPLLTSQTASARLASAQSVAHGPQPHKSTPRGAPLPSHRVTPSPATCGTAPYPRMVVATLQPTTPALSSDALRRRKQAAMRISAWAASIVRRHAALRATRNAAAATIAKTYRRYKLQRSYYVRRAQRLDAARQAAEVETHRAIEAHHRRRRNAALDILHWYQQRKCECLLRRLNDNVAAIKSRPDRDASAARIQRFWSLSKERLQTLRLNEAQRAVRARVQAEQRIIHAAVKIQGRYRTFLHRHVLAERRAAFYENRSIAAIVIQKHVRRWLAKNVFWQEKMSKLSMFRELQRLRQKERARISGAPVPQAPRHAW